MLLSLRLGEQNHKDQNYINELIETLKNSGNCIDEVWFASSYGLLSAEQCRENAKQMKTAAEKFKNNNIVTSMQISRTVGHTDSLATCGGDGVKDLDLDLITDINGVKSAGLFCFNNSQFRKYLYETLKEYAALKPEICWFDDDLRIRNIGKSYALCFCETCISKFNAKYGYNYTREKLKDGFLFNKEIRNQYIGFQTDSLNEFTEIVSSAIISVSPDTVLALQNGGNTTLATNTQKVCLDTMKKICGKNPAFRAGGGFYKDHNPEEMLDKAIQLNYINSRLPDYVHKRCSEIENLPFVAYGKSPECTPIEAALYMAYGCNMASVTLMFTHEPLSFHKEMFQKLAIYKPYLKNLAEHTKNTHNSGICVYQPVNSPLCYTADDAENKWNATSIFEAKPLMRCGIPFHSEIESDVYFLSPKACDYITKEDMEILLKKPVITDAVALNKLFSLGYGDKIYANVEELEEKFQNSTFEKTTAHTINNGICLERWSDSKWDSLDRRYKITGDNIDAVSHWHTYIPDEKIGIASAVVKTAYGAKWYVKGAHLCNGTISFNRRNQLVNAINYISEKLLVAYVGTPQQIVAIARSNDNGKLISVTLLNVSTTDYTDIELIVNNPENSKNCTLTNPYADSVKIPLSKKGDSYSVSIDSLNPWRIKTVYFE